MSLSLYIHIPWCVRKCPYCDFNSHHAPEQLPEQDYVAKLIADLKTDIERYQINKPVQTIFIGGGTPSLFSANAIGELLENVDRVCGISSNAEITMEANPGTIERQYFAGYRQAGVNRLSLGVQSFADEQLHLLGRIHDGNEAISAVEIARQAGFTNINLDLMFGLPKQSLAQGIADLEQALALGPEHVSWYQLTLEPNTVFYKKPPKLPNDDLIADLQDAGQTLLAEHGFTQYEISAYAQAGRQCQHNLNYWQFGDYLGIGAGAHGKLTTADGMLRTRKKKIPKTYLAAEDCLAEELKVEAEAVGFEYMLNALRLNQAINIAEFTQRTGLTLADIDSAINAAKEQQLITVSETQIQKTALGQRFLNDLLQLFL